MNLKRLYKLYNLGIGIDDTVSLLIKSIEDDLSSTSKFKFPNNERYYCPPKVVHFFNNDGRCLVNYENVVLYINSEYFLYYYKNKYSLGELYELSELYDLILTIFNKINKKDFKEWGTLTTLFPSYEREYARIKKINSNNTIEVRYRR